MKKLIYGLLAISVISTALYSPSSDAKDRPERQPPQEAFDACVSLDEESVVSFTSPRGDTIEATCQLIDGQLVAVPTNPPSRERKQRANNER